MNTSSVYPDTNGLEIAIIGMTGRFPGASSVDELWQKLCDGAECITFFSDQELLASGIDPALLRLPNYVKAGGILGDIESFDASFFEFNPREAEILDPQHRFFLECAWEALEHAGYNPETYTGLIGVYAGIGMNHYFLSNVSSNHALLESLGSFQIMLGNDKDFMPTRVSYKLNLRGPSVNVNTACSTSLVAVHLACQSLLNGECDMALAGGVSIAVPQKQGYLYQEGGILSPDGHCRAFDARAQGTVGGSGVGIVVVKRLADALADGDCIHAVIKGSAINNDGSVKVGYTAPGVNGQGRVIRAAQLMAEIDAETITYVETHGTGTPLGDPIEIDALTQAFRISTQKNGFCAIGSVKANVGHLDAAAGVTGLIKTVLALKHKMLPPSLHFEQPNPQINFANSPFYVNRALAEWKAGSVPRRAGVSSFGIGGTNAHIILEEAPEMEAAGSARSCQLIVLSARTPSALEVASANLVDYCKQHPDCNLADLAYTLQVGRKAFSYRRVLVCHDLNELVRKLETRDAQQVWTQCCEGSDRAVVFMFPGGGAQYSNMASELYQIEPYFRRQIDLCAELLLPHLGLDLRSILYPGAEQLEEAAKQLRRTSIALPALFVTEYALARLWMAWGIAPQAMIGHSLGEYTAACLAGVFSLEDALSLVVLRGKLFESLPSGAMLSIPLPEHEVRALLSEKLSLAAVNGPSQCVVAGRAEDIDVMARLLTERELDVQQVHIDVAAHSEMVTPILSMFAGFVEKMELHAPTIPYISNVTGTWITAEEATDPHYWARHLRQTVRFTDGITELLNVPNWLLLEVGPGRTLSTLAKLQIESAQAQSVFSSLRHPHDRQSDTLFLLATLGKLWLAGVQIHWPELYAGERRLRVPLPTYPFERERFWIEPQEQPSARGTSAGVAGKKSDIAEWFYIPSWKRSMPQKPWEPGDLRGEQADWLIFVDDYGLGAHMAERLEREGQSVITVRVGGQFGRLSENSYTLNPCQDGDYQALLRDLRALNKLPQMIVTLWNITANEPPVPGPALFKDSQDTGYYSLILLIQSLEKEGVISLYQEKKKLSILVVANNLHEVTYEESISPEKATILGPCKVIPQEYPDVTCHCVDIVLPHGGTQQESRLLDQLLAEMRGPSSDTVIAYRGKQRWVQAFEAVYLDSQKKSARQLRQRGVYLITGGLGRVGLLLAEYLARTVQARLVLIGRSGLPPRAEWKSWLADSNEPDAIQRKIQRVQAMETSGAEVLVLSADVADEEQMQAAVRQTFERFGALHGVLHAAGVTADKSISCPLNEIDRAASAVQFRPKVHGVYVLEKVLRDKGIDFCLLFSSNAAILGGLGFVAYAAANLFMDAFSNRQNAMQDVPWISANWDGWPGEEEEEQERVFRTSMDRYIMSSQEAVEAFERLVTRSTVGQVVVSTGDLQPRMSIWLARGASRATASSEKVGTPVPQHQRPELRSTYAAPSNEFERRIAEIWQNLLGVEQVGIFDNFFELGGHSLLGTQLVSRLRDVFQIKLPLSCLFESPTVAELATAVVQRLAGQIDSELLVELEQLSQDEVQTMLTSGM